MLVFEFIGTKNKTGWIEFMIKEVIHKNQVIQTLGKRPTIIESASVISEKCLDEITDTEEKEKTSIQYKLGVNPNNNQETKTCEPLVKIYTTMPGALIDELRSLIKAGIKIEEAVTKTFLLSRKLNSAKKRRELTVLARIYSMEPDGFNYLIIKC